MSRALTWRTFRYKLGLFGLVLLAVGGAYLWLGDQLTLAAIARREAELRAFQERHPGWAYGLAFFIYVSVTGASLPGGAALSLLYGWYFGFWQALPLLSFASTAGATVAFLLSRFLLRDPVQQLLGDRLHRFNVTLEREGAWYLFSLRLAPVVPFVVINAGMGLTPLRTWTFWWVSQLGMLPGTIVFTYAGASVPDLQTLAQRKVAEILTPQVIAAFLLLALFPWLAKGLIALVHRIRASRGPN